MTCAIWDVWLNVLAFYYPKMSEVVKAAQTRRHELTVRSVFLGLHERLYKAGKKQARRLFFGAGRVLLFCFGLLRTQSADAGSKCLPHHQLLLPLRTLLAPGALLGLRGKAS